MRGGCATRASRTGEDTDADGGHGHRIARLSLPLAILVVEAREGIADTLDAHHVGDGRALGKGRGGAV